MVWHLIILPTKPSKKTFSFHSRDDFLKHKRSVDLCIRASEQIPCDIL